MVSANQSPADAQLEIAYDVNDVITDLSNRLAACQAENARLSAVVSSLVRRIKATENPQPAADTAERPPTELKVV